MSTFFQWLIDILQNCRFWFVVDPWEKAVRVRLGKNARIIPPGFHWKIPLLDEIYILYPKLRLGPASTQTISTKDGRVVTLGITTGFSIIDPLQALSTYQHPENSIAVLVHHHAAEYISSRNIEEISIPELEDFIIEGLKTTDPENGIAIEFIKVTNFMHSSPARTIRLVQDDIITDFSSQPTERSKFQPNVTQW